MDTLEVLKPTQTYSNPNKSGLGTSSSRVGAKRVVYVPKSVMLTTKKAVELLLNGSLRGKVCRFCLHITSSLCELDQIMNIAGEGALYKVTIRDIVASFHPYEIPDDPNIPNKICEKCLDRALQCYRFTQKCEQAERALRNCLDDMYDKLNKLDPLEQNKRRGRRKLNPNHNTLFTEHRYVIDYAEPLHNLVNVGAESLTKETEMGKFECKKCWQVLPNLESLLNHEKSHPKTMRYTCRLCCRSFVNRLHINKHLRQHAKEKRVAKTEVCRFVCKQCGFTSDNYNVHLQHVEKHKFKMVMEHLVEKKMDKLCSVCFDRNRKLMNLDQMICLHGGYAELTGDRSLYHILGATVQEPNYKYQELYIAEKAKILSITKKIDEDTGIYKATFVLSDPIIITVENVNDVEKYIFDFSKTDMFDINDSSTGGLNDDNNDHGIEVIDISEQVNNVSDDITRNNLDDSNRNNETDLDKTKTIENNVIETAFPKHDYEHGSTIKNPNTSSDKELCCKTGWIFNKPMCNTCKSKKYNEDNIVTEDTNEINKSCQFCWVFKHAEQCVVCKSPNKINQIPIETEFNQTSKVLNRRTDDIQSNTKDIDVSENSHEIITAKNPKRRKLSEEIDFEAKKAKWQCKICLTTNNGDRQTCLCCESECDYKYAIKLKFNPDNEWFGNIKIAKMDTQIGEAQIVSETKDRVVYTDDIVGNDTKSTQKLESTHEANKININLNINTMMVDTIAENPLGTAFVQPTKVITEPDNITIEDNIVTTANNVSGFIQQETMDVTEDTTPIPNVSTLCYPNPFSLAFMTAPVKPKQDFPSVPPFPNIFQFNIGSGHSGRSDRFMKKFKKNYRRGTSHN